MPECLLNFSSLKHLSLNNNALQGTVPALPAESKLVVLALHRNGFTGALSTSWHVQHLAVLTLHDSWRFLSRQLRHVTTHNTLYTLYTSYEPYNMHIHATVPISWGQLLRLHETYSQQKFKRGGNDCLHTETIAISFTLYGAIECNWPVDRGCLVLVSNLNHTPFRQLECGLRTNGFLLADVADDWSMI